MMKPAGKPELVLLFESGDCWSEQRVSLPEGLESGVFTFHSPGLKPMAWVLSLLHMRASIRQVGTLGAVWAVFEADERVQLWVPGPLEVPEGAVVQVMFSEAP